MLGVVQQVVDEGKVWEIMRDYAQNIITGGWVMVGVERLRCWARWGLC